MARLKLHENSKINNIDIGGYCVLCLEDRLFRHVMFNGKNCTICTGCLAAKPLIKIEDIKRYGFKNALTFTDKLIRVKIRLIAFFTGRHNRKRFDLRLLRGK